MSKVHETLRKKSDNTVEVYPNIESDNIPSCAITTPKIADGAIVTLKLADGSITTAKIIDSAITTDKLANNAVTSSKIADGNVTTSKINNSAVTTDKLATSSVTTAKIADSAVNNDKILNNTIKTTKLAEHLYQHTYHLKVGSATVYIEFIFIDYNKISVAYDDVDDINARISSIMPSTFGSYIKNLGFTPNANDRSINQVTDTEFEVYDNLDESVSLNRNTMTIIQSVSTMIY